MRTFKIRPISDDEEQAFELLMKAAGSHVGTEFHSRLAEWRRAGAVQEVNFLGELGVLSPPSMHDGPVFSVFSYEHVVEVLRNPSVFSSEAVRPSTGKAWGKTILTEDPPDHDKIHTLGMGFFTRRALAAWKDEIFEPTVRQYVDAILSVGHGDIHKQVFLPFPVTVLHSVLGLDHDPEESSRFHRLSLQQFLARMQKDPSVGMKATEELFDYFFQLIQTSREQQARGVSPEDLLGQMVAVNDREHYVDDDELTRFFRILLPAGADTTTNATGNMFVNFLQNPDQLDLVRDNPSLVGPAVEESIRHNNSSVAIYRGCTEEYELGGVRIPKGAMVVLSLAAANRDEERYTEPDRFDITRKDGGHVGFGHGIHLCIGLHMARMEMSSALEVIVEMMPRLRPDPDFDMPETRGALYRHPSHLNVRWD